MEKGLWDQFIVHLSRNITLSLRVTSPLFIIPLLLFASLELEVEKLRQESFVPSFYPHFFLYILLSFFRVSYSQLFFCFPILEVQKIITYFLMFITV